MGHKSIRVPWLFRRGTIDGDGEVSVWLSMDYWDILSLQTTNQVHHRGFHSRHPHARVIDTLKLGNRKSRRNLSSLSFKGAVINGNKIPAIPAIPQDHKHSRFTKSSKRVNTCDTSVEILLQLNLVVGPTSNWEVSQAQILNSTANAQGQAPHGPQPTHGAQTKHNSMVLGPKHKAAQQVSQV